MWTLLSRVQGNVHSIEGKFEQNAQLAVSNDKSVKQGLKEMEALVNQYGEELKAVPVLRSDVQGAVRDMAAVLQQQSSGGTAAGLAK